MNSLIRAILPTNAGTGLAILHIITNPTLMSRGLQKPFDVFGGANLSDVARQLESIGLTPGYPLTALADSTEFLGGLALVIGLLVRPASVVVGFAMIIAIFNVHIGNGLLVADNSYEHAPVLLMISVTLLISGTDEFSLGSKLSC